MVLDPLLEGCDWKILATDISTRVLGRAAEAVYGEEEMEPVPEQLRSRHFQLVPAGSDGALRWAVKPRLKERIVFHRMNLAHRPYAMSGPLDAVFCRNVMIYFDRPMREGLVREFERLLRPGAPLYVGHSETLNGIPTRLRTERPSVYRQPEEVR
jgi:chemotaxis protein methyltransferase CheR